MNCVDTVAAISTPPGRGGVAVVRISGDDALTIASKVTGRELTADMAGRFFRANFHLGEKVVDDGIALVFAAPRSYTGEDTVELQCHGGVVAPRRVLEACLAAGARIAGKGEFTKRAFLNGRLDLGEAEAVLDMIDARNVRAADDAFARLGGALSAPLEKMYQVAIGIASAIEHALDVSEEELPDGFGARRLQEVHDLMKEAKRCLASAREGRILREGALVVLAGAPNAGKSSLLNALLGCERAIVSNVAGTTRDFIEEAIEIGGWPVRLVDTAGIREDCDLVEAEGVARAKTLVDAADVVIALDCDIPGAIRVHAKCDLDVNEMRQKNSIAVSAFTGYGLEELCSAISTRLAILAGEKDEANLADITTRQAEGLFAAVDALTKAAEVLDNGEWVIAAGEVRKAVEAFGRLLGRDCSEDILDAIFSRFCVGK